MEKMCSNFVTPEITEESTKRSVVPGPIAIPKMTEEQQLAFEANQKEIKEEETRILQTLSPDYNASKTMWGIQLKGKSKSGFTITCKIDVKASGYTFWLKVPSSWDQRLIGNSYWPGSDFDELMARWDALLNEDESILKPVTYLYEQEDFFEALNFMQANFEELIAACRTDVAPEERVKIQKELEIYLSEDSTLENIWYSEIKGCYSFQGINPYWYLVFYKGLGFILSDAGNSNWHYISTAEEFLLNFHWDPKFHTRKL